MWISEATRYDVFEFDEIFWFIKSRKGVEKGINAYLITMISRFPRQILGYNVDKSRTAEQMQRIADGVMPADSYATDGNPTYLDVDFQGKHIRNIRDKRDTHNVESVNADIRHYIAGLRRKSGCFFGRLKRLER